MSGGSRLPSIDTLVAAIRGTIDQVADTMAGISRSTEQTDDVRDRLAALGIEGRAAIVSSTSDRLGECQPLLLAIADRLRTALVAAESAKSGGAAPPTSTISAGGGPGNPPLAPKVIGGRLYSIHAQERMLDPTRNVSAPEIERALVRGKSRPGKNPGTTDYYDVEAKIHLVVNETGGVVTVRRQSRVPGWAKA
jgi:hypothetical protein